MTPKLAVSLKMRMRINRTEGSIETNELYLYASTTAAALIWTGIIPESGSMSFVIGWLIILLFLSAIFPMRESSPGLVLGLARAVVIMAAANILLAVQIPIATLLVLQLCISGVVVWCKYIR